MPISEIRVASCASRVDSKFDVVYKAVVYYHPAPARLNFCDTTPVIVERCVLYIFRCVLYTLIFKMVYFVTLHLFVVERCVLYILGGYSKFKRCVFIYAYILNGLFLLGRVLKI